VNKTNKIKVKSNEYTANLPKDFKQPTDTVGRRLLKEYGALFVARGGAIPPKKVIFKSEREVSSFQASLSKSIKTVGSFEIELQTAAMKALKKAIIAAEQNCLTITPRGADAAKRNYADTVALWKSRVNPALAHWVEKGNLEPAEASKISRLSPFDQVVEVFNLESQGMFCSKDLLKSIIYSVAPPGTSQHLSLLALDVNEHNDPSVRDVLSEHGWFQTVVSDLPHFTFLGVLENQLPNLGLKKVSDNKRTFWLPNL